MVLGSECYPTDLPNHIHMGACNGGRLVNTDSPSPPTLSSAGAHHRLDVEGLSFPPLLLLFLNNECRQRFFDSTALTMSQYALSLPRLCPTKEGGDADPACE